MSDLCKMCNLKANPWKMGITESWPTFLNGRVRYWAGPSYQPPSATAWPHYITTNWPQVVPQKAHRCEDKQKSFDLPLLLGKASVWVTDFGFLSPMLCTCISCEFRVKCNSVSHHSGCIWCSSNSGTVSWLSGTVTWLSQITSLE